MQMGSIHYCHPKGRSFKLTRQSECLQRNFTLE